MPREGQGGKITAGEMGRIVIRTAWKSFKTALGLGKTPGRGASTGRAPHVSEDLSPNLIPSQTVHLFHFPPQLCKYSEQVDLNKNKCYLIWTWTSASQTNALVSPWGKTIITLQLAQALAYEEHQSTMVRGKEMGGLKNPFWFKNKQAMNLPSWWEGIHFQGKWIMVWHLLPEMIPESS